MIRNAAPAPLTGPVDVTFAGVLDLDGAAYATSWSTRERRCGRALAPQKDAFRTRPDQRNADACWRRGVIVTFLDLA
jgi:hypothetical protein